MTSHKPPLPPGRKPIKARDPILHSFLELLDHAKITYPSVERRAGYSRGSLSRYRRGKSAPTTTALADYCQALGITVTFHFSNPPDNGGADD